MLSLQILLDEEPVQEIDLTLLLLQQALTEDEELAMALAMSVEGSEPAAASSSGQDDPLQGAAKSAVHDSAEAAAIQADSTEENIMAAANAAASQVLALHFGSSSRCHFMYLTIEEVVPPEPAAAVTLSCVLATALT